MPEHVLHGAHVLSLLVADTTGRGRGRKPGKAKPREARRAPAPLTSEEALRQAEAEGLLVVREGSSPGLALTPKLSRTEPEPGPDPSLADRR